MSEVLLMGGTHGNEPFGVNLVQSLTESPIKGIDSVIANEPATAAGKRFVDQELSCSNPVPDSNIYEEKRIAELLVLMREYRLVLDIHTNRSDRDNEAWVRPGSSELTRQVLGFLGIRYVMASSNTLLNNQSGSTVIGIELPLPPEHEYQSWRDRRLIHWRSTLEVMAEKGLDALPKPSPAHDLTFMGSLHEISRADAERLDLKVFPDPGPYQRIPFGAATALGLTAETVRLSWGYKNMSEGRYFGSVAQAVEPFI